MNKHQTSIIKSQAGNAVATILGVVALVAAASVGSYYLGTMAQNPLDREIVRLAGDNMQDPLVEAFAEEGDPVVAIVDGQKVHRSAVLVALSDMAQGVDKETAASLFPEFLDQYVNILLLTDAAREAGIEDSEAVQTEIELAEDQILRAAFLNAQFTKALDESNLEAMYQQMVAAQPDQDEINARHILVETKEKAEELIAQAKGGADFATLAQEHSTGPSAATGGDLGYFVRAQMVPEFSEAAFALQEDEISDTPVQTQFGWHVIKVEDRRAREKPSFEEMREALSQQLRQTVTQGIVRNLRDEADVTLFDLNGEEVVMEAEEDSSEAEDSPEATDTTTE